MISSRFVRHNSILERGLALGVQSISSSSSRSLFPSNHKTAKLVQRRLASNLKNEGKTTSDGNLNKAEPTFLQRWMAPKEIPPRGTMKWYREMTLICTVFAITGTSTMVLVRPAMSEVLGLQGSLKDGPWSYRICSIVIMTPLYSTLLVCVGTIFGRHFYFRHFAVKVSDWALGKNKTIIEILWFLLNSPSFCLEF